jgi:hypothetical protein
VALTLLLLTVILTLTVPRLNTASQAVSARTAQVSIEAAATAFVDLYHLTGRTPTDLSVVASMVPTVDLLGPSYASTAVNKVSVASSGNTVVFAAADEEGWCWVLVRRLDPQGAAAELKIALDGAVCEGNTALVYASANPASGAGGSWAKPWTP